MVEMLKFEETYPQVIIDGDLEEGVIIVRIAYFIPSFKFLMLVNKLRNLKFKFTKIYNDKFWIKEVNEFKDFEEIINELENFLIEAEIDFVNEVKGYMTAGEKWI